jgi:hypothetical protein
MRLRPAGGLDLAAGTLIVGGAVLIAASIIAAVMLVTPPVPNSATARPSPTASTTERPLDGLPADHVAVVLNVDVAAAAGGAARAGDHVDVLGYFSRQVTGSEGMTRLLIPDVPVLAVDRSGASVALTVAVTQDAALLLQEAETLGARPFVTLLDAYAGAADTSPRTFSDSDLAKRVTGTH